MTETERVAWRVVEWCEDRGIPAPQRCAFAVWYAQRVATPGLTLPFYPAYVLWREQS